MHKKGPREGGFCHGNTWTPHVNVQKSAQVPMLRRLSRQATALLLCYATGTLVRNLVRPPSGSDQ